MTDGMLVYITAANQEEAQRLGRTLVERRLAACANIVPAIRSIYMWEGKLVEDGETLVFLKSTAEALDDLVACVRELHSYSVPCVTAFPIAGGNGEYIQWIFDSVDVPRAATADGSKTNSPDG